jgi:hypothetical protein
MHFRITAQYVNFTGYHITMSAQAQRVRPAAPTAIPDGTSASEQDMLHAMHQFKQYNEAVETYLKWLEFEARISRIDAWTERRLHNEAVDVLSANVDRFNQQLRVYRARGSLSQPRAAEAVH